jgi:hypothetical protein
MAQDNEPTPEQLAAWEEWVASRSECVRKVAERFNPWTLYRLKTSGKRVTIRSFETHEDGSVTLTVDVTGEYNLVTFDRHVFGVSPENLESCDFPNESELVGTMLTEKDDVEHFIALQKRIMNRGK